MVGASVARTTGAVNRQAQLFDNSHVPYYTPRTKEALRENLMSSRSAAQLMQTRIAGGRACQATSFNATYYTYYFAWRRFTPAGG
jgi:hypothetical protein